MRKIIVDDTTQWLKTIDSMDSVITSLPDAEETNMDFKEWRRWFVDCIVQIMQKTENYCIFYQTDRKKNGSVKSKSFLVNYAAEKAGMDMKWHKIVLRRKVGTVDLFRPGYTHLICFSKNGKSGKATPDVIDKGKMIYKNAMGLDACKFACDFVKANSNTKTIFDPFCGQGSIVAMAEMFGFDAVGVEILPEYAEKSRKLVIPK